MEQTATQKNLKDLEDWELLAILCNEEDRVPRQVVDEIVSRGERMIMPLWDMMRNWRGDGEDWWTGIHITFILGAIAGKDVMTPLIMSLRLADTYDCDWILEQLPAIFGKIGPAVIEPLKKIVLDLSNNWSVRTTALQGIAAVVIHQPRLSRDIFDFVAQILKDPYDEMIVRGSAGMILLDFNQQQKYQKSLLEFAEEDMAMREENPYHIYHFTKEHVLADPRSDERCLEFYKRDWLDFYNAEEIEVRQRRWQKEDKENRWFRKLWWKIRSDLFRWKK
jgi:hypothetical protein